MKAKWITTAILASAITAPAFAGVGVYIGTAPPPLRYEVRPAMPGPGYGAGLPSRAHIGRILTTTTMTTGGNTTRVIGTTMITVTTTTGITTKNMANPRSQNETWG
jgi:hypothetical protein